jgi:hypothetical protein
MNRVQEIKHWLEEGNLYRAEKAIHNCSNDLTSDEKQEFESILNEISVRHYQLLAGKAILSKDESLLKICIQKLNEKGTSVQELQNSLHQFQTEKKAKMIQKTLIVLVGLITIMFFGLFLLT